MRLSLETFNGCGNAQRSIARKRAAEDALGQTSFLHEEALYYTKLLLVNIRAPDEVDHDLVEDQALDAEGLADLREDLVVAPVA